MRFSSGMLGALIVTLALMGTVAMGFMSSVEKVATTDIEYSYLTDATSLYSYTTDPEYVDYSPSVNYTHYSTSFNVASTASGATFYTDGITYTQTANNLVNPYRVYAQSNTVTNDLTLTSALPTLTGSGNSSNYTLIGANIIYFNGHDSITDQGRYSGCYVSSLASIISNSTISSASNIHTFRFDNDTSPWVIYGSTVQWRDTVMNSNTNLHLNILRSNESRCEFGADIQAAYAIYNDVNNEITVYRADGYSLYTGNPSNVYMVFGGTATVTSFHHAPGTTLRVETTATQPPTYMDISQGVTFQNTSVYWSNGYDLGNVSILVKAPTATASPLKVYSLNATGNPISEASISYGSTGFPIGDWDAVLLTIDYVGGTYSIRGVTNLVSMTDYSVSEYGQTYALTYTGTDTSVPHVLKFSAPVNTWTVNVSSTKVYLSTSSQVMQNPSINLDAYFLNEDYLRLTFDSFAYYGTSFTVNGNTYQVNNGKINLYADGKNRTFDLTKTMITWEDGKVYLGFRNSNAVVDLGTYTEKTMQLAGSWYFTSSVYEGKSVNSHTWEYHFGEWDMSQAAFILVFLGILGVGAAYIHVRRGLTAIDIAALALVGLTAFLLLG